MDKKALNQAKKRKETIAVIKVMFTFAHCMVGELYRNRSKEPLIDKIFTYFTLERTYLL